MKNDKAKIVEIINEEILQERLVTHSTEIHREISKIPNLKRINFWSTASSMVGLYRYEPDGYAYEIEIRPVEIGRYKDLWGNQIKKREERQNEGDDVNEGDKKWIQKAVNPEHKGYCTPMTKPTCTPARKALAKRFKKGIEDESYGTADPLGTNMAKQINEEPIKYRAEVTGKGENVWSTNALEFNTEEEAQKYLDDLSGRWFGFDMGRVVPTSMPKGQRVDMVNDIIYLNYRK